MEKIAMRVADILLDQNLVCLSLEEASVHLPKRGRIWVATFTGPEGGQTWKTTGTTNRAQAMALAKEWEAEARQERLANQGALARARIHGELTHAEVAAILGISERAVRQIERRALEKLRRHPLIHQLRRELRGGRQEQEESMRSPLTFEEAKALFDLLETDEEARALCRVLEIVQS